MDEIAELQARIAALEARIAMLEARQTLTVTYPVYGSSPPACPYCHLPPDQCRGHNVCTPTLQ